ncbi:MAG: hypothetical protein WCK49_01270 [Myxococcaceae bacterium]
MVNRILNMAFYFSLSGLAFADSNESWENRKERARSRLTFSAGEADIVDAFDKFRKSFWQSSGFTPLAQHIIDSELSANREAPVRVKLDFCDVPAAYASQLSQNRFLMSCVMQDQIACLDVSNAFMGKPWLGTRVGTSADKSFKCEKKLYGK